MAAKLTKLDVVLLVMVCLNLAMIGYVWASRAKADSSAPVLAAEAGMPENILRSEPSANSKPEVRKAHKKFTRFETAIECGGIPSKIISQCSPNGQNCKNQKWLVSGKKIELNKVLSWGCLQDQSQSRIVFFHGKGHSEIWTLDGATIMAGNHHGR